MNQVKVGLRKTKKYGLVGFVTAAALFALSNSVQADEVSVDNNIPTTETLTSTYTPIPKTEDLNNAVSLAKEANVKVEETTPVQVKSEDEANTLMNENAKEISDTVSKYTSEVKSYEEEKTKAEQAQAEYETKLNQYNEQKSAYEEYQKQVSDNTGAGEINTIQSLTLKTEPEANTTVSGDNLKFITRDGVEEMKSTDDYLKSFDTDKIKDSYLTEVNPYNEKDDSWVYLKEGQSVTVTSTNLTNSKFKDSKISKIVRTFTVASTPSNNNYAIANIHRDPFKTITIGSGTDNTKPLRIVVKDSYFDENGNELNVSDGSAILAVNSLNHYKGLRYVDTDGSVKFASEDTDHIEKVILKDNKFIPIPGSSVTDNNGVAYSVNDNEYIEHGSKFNSDTVGTIQGWDNESSPNFYYGSGAMRLYSNTYEFEVSGNAKDTPTVYWFAINTNVAFPQKPELPIKPEPFTKEKPISPIVKIKSFYTVEFKPRTPKPQTDSEKPNIPKSEQPKSEKPVVPKSEKPKEDKVISFDNKDFSKNTTTKDSKEISTTKTLPKTGDNSSKEYMGLFGLMSMIVGFGLFSKRNKKEQ